MVEIGLSAELRGQQARPRQGHVAQQGDFMLKSCSIIHPSGAFPPPSPLTVSVCCTLQAVLRLPGSPIMVMNSSATWAGGGGGVSVDKCGVAHHGDELFGDLE